ncbi:MAG: gas vesicle protein [Bacteroidota bacterium]
MDKLKEIEEYDPEERKMLLSDVLDRVLHQGVTITGDLKLGIADVDLIYCGLRVLLTSIEKLEEETSSSGDDK